MIGAPRPRPQAGRLNPARQRGRWIFQAPTGVVAIAWVVAAMCAVSCAFGPSVGGVALAQEVATQDVIETVEGERLEGRMIAWEARSVTFQPAAEGEAPRDWGIADLVAIELAGTQPTAANAQPAAPHRVELRGGGTLAGKVSSWKNATLQIESAGRTWNVPQDWVARIMFAAGATAAEPAEGDVLQVVTPAGSRQAITGRVLDLADDSLGFEYQGTARRVKLERVVAVTLLARRAASEGMGPERLTWLTVSVPGATRIPVLGERLTDEEARLTTAWGESVATPRAGLRLAVRNGRLIDLTERAPQQVAETPYFDRVIPWTTTAPRGGFRLGDQRYRRGLLMHSRSQLTYALAEDFQRFRATLGLQLPEGRLGAVDVRVRVDGREVLAREGLVATDPPLPVDIDLRGAKSLQLEVDFGPGEDVGDRVLWAEPILVRDASGAAK